MLSTRTRLSTNTYRGNKIGYFNLYLFYSPILLLLTLNAILLLLVYLVLFCCLIGLAYLQSKKIEIFPF